MNILPVTALCSLNDHSIILTGSGPYLALYRDNKLLIKMLLLSKSVTIHAIIASKQDSQNLIAIYGQKELQIVKYSPLNEVEQIYRKPLVFSDWIMTCNIMGKYICVITMHNIVLILNLATGNVLQHFEPISKHIIYSACLHGENIDILKIASGSVFNKILIWKPNALKQVELIGHQGVIFRVRFNATATKLISVSDDRTVRLWNVDTQSLLGTFYGHNSRVWDAQFIPGSSDSEILSIGEDCTLKLWNVDLCRCVHTFLGHRGKNIWSLAVDSKFAYTGGNDCTVRKWNLTPFLKECENFPVSISKFEFEAPRSVRNLDASTCIILTNLGRIWVYYIHTRKLTQTFHNELFSSYSVMALSNKRDIIALGGLSGDVILLRVPDWGVVFLDRIVKSKVLSLNWYSQFLIVCGQDGECILSRVCDDTIEKLNSLFLPHSSHRWVTSFVTNENDSFSLISGDAKGSIHLYTKLKSDKVSMPTHSLSKIHGPNPVTSIQILGDLMYSTGRDGKSILLGVENGKLILKNSFQVLKNCGWLERIYMVPGGPILAVAFHANEILLVNVREDAILLAIPCGGGHRSWDINSFEEIMTGHFFLSFVKCSEVLNLSRRFEPVSIRPFSTPFLGRECVSICLLNKVENNMLLACGDEIGDLSILKWDGDQNLEVVTTNQCHVGNILCLESCCHSNGGMFMFSAGGRGSLKAWEMNSKKPNSIFEIYFFAGEVSAKPIYKKNSKDSEIDDFRITTIQVISADKISENLNLDFVIFCGCSDGYLRVYTFEKKTGFKLVTLAEHAPRCVLSSCLYFHENKTPVFMTAATDGVIIIWNISPLTTYLQKNLNFSQDTLLVKSSFFVSHQSGVNSISTFHNFPFVKVTSGGDDNCVTITNLECVRNVYKVVDQIRDSNQHASSIMATDILNLDGVIYIVTLSRDQVLKVFKDFEERKMELVAIEETSVTNISGMECKLLDGKVCVFVIGEGIQFISLAL